VHVGDAQLVKNTSPQGLGRALHGRRIGHPHRYGKWLVIPADDGHLVMNFAASSALKWAASDDGVEDSDRVIFEFDDGQLRYHAQRRFGGIWWVPPHSDISQVTGTLAPDAASLGRIEFRERLGSHSGAIKAALMDQKIIAGLGNELSDEILWRAGIGPKVMIEEIDDARLSDLYDAMQESLRRAMEPGRIPAAGSWMDRIVGQDIPACPRCGIAIETTKIAGRCSYWCPRCQT
jgi:formamidopyrimidine-DNA glycosylase